MNSDWLDSLTSSERREWDTFVDHVRKNTVKMMTESAFVMSLAPGDAPDIKFAVELGLAIMLDKPLFVVQMPGRDVPARLRMVADAVVRADLDTEDGQRVLAARLKKFRETLR